MKNYPKHSPDTRRNVYARKYSTIKPANDLTVPSYYVNQPYPNQPYRNPNPQQNAFSQYSQTNAFSQFSSQLSAFPFDNANYGSQTHMGSSLSQQNMQQPMSLIPPFSYEDMYEPQHSDPYQNSLVEVTTRHRPRPSRSLLKYAKSGRLKTRMHPGAFHGPMRNKLRYASVRGKQNKCIWSSNIRYGEQEMEDGAPERGSVCRMYADVMRKGRQVESETKIKSKRHFLTMKLNTEDDEENEVHEVERQPNGMNKAKILKKKGVGSSGTSSTMNEEALA
nr:hypothetical protein [Tanacetum cinerariifolium]